MVDNELNSDEYNSKRSRDRPLACVLASRMLASYVPLTERWGVDQIVLDTIGISRLLSGSSTTES